MLSAPAFITFIVACATLSLLCCPCPRCWGFSLFPAAAPCRGRSIAPASVVRTHSSSRAFSSYSLPSLLSTRAAHTPRREAPSQCTKKDSRSGEFRCSLQSLGARCGAESAPASPKGNRAVTPGGSSSRSDSYSDSYDDDHYEGVSNVGNKRDGAQYRPANKIQGKPDHSLITPRSPSEPSIPHESAALVRSRIRVMGGSQRGRVLFAPAGIYLRPMMSRVKAAVFSTLSHLRSIRGASFLDLFCGVGSVGIEALSRGAAAATFVDASPHCVEATRMNIRSCKFSSNENSVICANAFDVLSGSNATRYERLRLRPADVLTATPPYEEISYEALLNGIAASTVLRCGGIAIVEYPVELGTLPFSPCDGALLGLRNRRYGRTVIAMYEKGPDLSSNALISSGLTSEYRPEEFSNGPVSH